MNNVYHNLSGVINSMINEDVNHSEKIRVRHILNKLKHDFTPIYVVVAGHSASVVSNYMLATYLIDNIDCRVYGVWFDHIGDVWHVVEQ